MASVRKRGKAWQATIRGPDGKERTKTYAKKVDAERWANTQEADKARGTWIDPTAGRVTFGQFALSWAEGQVWRPTTAEGVRRRLEHHVLPYLGDVPLANLRASHLRAWVKGRSDVLAPSTVCVCVQTVRSVLRAAVADRLIASSPANGLRLPRADREKVVPLTHEQVVAIRGAMPARYRAAVTLAAGAGLRQGELFGLTVDRVDWLRRTLKVDRQMVTVTGHGASLSPVKTPASVRAIPVPDVVLRALSEHLATRPAGDDGLILTTEDARPVTRNNAGHLWRRATRKVDGLPEDADGWHALRHFYASVLIRAGESVKVVQERLGHASAAVTLDTYTHLWPSDADRTRSAVEAVLGEAPADIPRTSAQG
jgi:integrase